MAHDPKLAKRAFCTNNHFDIDGFLGVWALHHPELALSNQDLLATMARLGDFREQYHDGPLFEQAIALVAHINEKEKHRFYSPFEMELEEEEACIPKYEFFLKSFTDLLTSNTFPDSFEYDQVMSQMELMSHNGQVIKYPAIRLAVIKAPEPMHYYPLFAQTADVDTVLTIYPGQRYELEQKYTTWVETARDSLPRVALGKLAKVLNQYEKGKEKIWEGDHFTETGPLLRVATKKLSRAERFDHPMNRQIVSSIIAEDVLTETVINYLTDCYRGIASKNRWSWGEVRKFNEGLA